MVEDLAQKETQRRGVRKKYLDADDLIHEISNGGEGQERRADVFYPRTKGSCVSRMTFQTLSDESREHAPTLKCRLKPRSLLTVNVY